MLAKFQNMEEFEFRILKAVNALMAVAKYITKECTVRKFIQICVCCC